MNSSVISEHEATFACGKPQNGTASRGDRNAWNAGCIAYCFLWIEKRTCACSDLRRSYNRSCRHSREELSFAQLSVACWQERGTVLFACGTKSAAMVYARFDSNFRARGGMLSFFTVYWPSARTLSRSDYGFQ
jgi:hypothetical protein